MNASIKLKNIVEEDFINYRKVSMFLGTSFCNWKCCIEQNLDNSICQNSSLASAPSKEFDFEFIYNRYINNNLSKSIVIGGLEPFMQFEEVYDLIKYFRDNNCNDDFVIYTGYNEDEIKEQINQLKEFSNIVIKFGRFVPKQKKHYDNVLGVELASLNQYGKRIS